MQASQITDIVIPILLALLVIAGVWAVIEIALTVRKARRTIESADEIIAKADPLVDHATLTIDAVNLEIMRVDGILEDVSNVTGTAAQAADVVSNVTNAPVQLASSIAERVRNGSKSRNRAKQLEHMVDDHRRVAAASKGAIGAGDADKAAADASKDEQLDQAAQSLAESAVEKAEQTADAAEKAGQAAEPTAEQATEQAAAAKPATD